MLDDGKFPSQTADKFVIRLPDGLRDRVKAAAARNNRTMNAEIVTAIEAACPDGVAGFVAIKRLEWVPVIPGGEDIEAQTPFGEYVISMDAETVGGTHYLWVAGQTEDEDFCSAYRTMQEAKASAQSDFERRIFSSLITQP